MTTEDRLRLAYQVARDPGPGCDVQIHVPGSWDDGSDWVVWCGSAIGRGATLDGALDALTAAMREQGGRWYSPANYQTAEEHAAAEAGEDDGLCERCAEEVEAES